MDVKIFLRTRICDPDCNRNRSLVVGSKPKTELVLHSLIHGSLGWRGGVKQSTGSLKRIGARSKSHSGAGFKHRIQAGLWLGGVIRDPIGNRMQCQS